MALLAFMFGLWAAGSAAEAARIQVDLASQTMRVTSASGDYEWPISSARAGYVTPRGSYGVQRLEAMHYSRKYHNSPMPHSIFFRGGYAIHGTYEMGSLGAPASHGCIRIAPENAALLYDIVRAEGARIAISGSAPADTRVARAERHRQRLDVATQQAYGQRRSSALGYAPPRFAPSFNDWVRNPAGYGTPGAMDYDPSPDESD
jgi:hypothetical protein